MSRSALPYLLAVMLAAVLDVGANLLLARSHGFTRRGPALGALALVGLAFTCLAYATRGMDLSVAYAMWGGFGILGTSLGGWAMLGQRPTAVAWLGMALLVAGITALHLV